MELWLLLSSVKNTDREHKCVNEGVREKENESKRSRETEFLMSIVSRSQVWPLTMHVHHPRGGAVLWSGELRAVLVILALLFVLVLLSRHVKPRQTTLTLSLIDQHIIEIQGESSQVFECSLCI